MKIMTESSQGNFEDLLKCEYSGGAVKDQRRAQCPQYCTQAAHAGVPGLEKEHPQISFGHLVHTAAYEKKLQ